MLINVENNYISVDAAIYYNEQSIRNKNFKQKIHTIIYGNNNKYCKFNIMKVNDDDDLENLL